MGIFEGYFPNNQVVGSGLTAAQLAKLNSLPEFQNRVDIITPAVEAVAPADAVAASVTYDFSGSTGSTARATITATTPGVAGNSIRFRLHVSESAAANDTLTNDANDDWSVHMNPGTLAQYRLIHIVNIINASSLTPPFTFTPVDPSNRLIVDPHISYVPLVGGAAAVAEVVGVPAVTMESEPTAGDGLEYTSGGHIQNSSLGLGVSYGPVQSIRILFSHDRDLISTGIILDVQKEYVINVGAQQPNGVTKATWELFTIGVWSKLPPTEIGGSLANTLYFNTFNQALYIARTEVNEILVATTHIISHSVPFAVKEVLS